MFSLIYYYLVSCFIDFVLFWSQFLVLVLNPFLYLLFSFHSFLFFCSFLKPTERNRKEKWETERKKWENERKEKETRRKNVLIFQLLLIFFTEILEKLAQKTKENQGSNKLNISIPTKNNFQNSNQPGQFFFTFLFFSFCFFYA